MKLGRILAAGVLAGSLTLGGVFAASAQDDILKYRIDDPKKDHWTTVGKEQKTSVPKSEGVPGGYAYRVKVNTAGANPWDIAAESSIAGPIKKGDVVLFAFWARAEKPPEGQPDAEVNVRVQQVAAPYTGVADHNGLKVGPEWKMYYAKGKSPLDLSAGQAKASVQLAKTKQTVDLGPSFVLNFGPDYDMSKLPGG